MAHGTNNQAGFERHLRLRRRRNARRSRDRTCPCCRRQVDFLWSCPCGFRMCQACMEENAWGLTCNSVTWTCPDCGRQRSY